MDKKHIIYNKINDNIKSNSNNMYLLSFIKNNDIIYTENNNGYFVNLNKLSDELIDKLYDHIFNYININVDNNIYTNLSEKKVEPHKQTIKYKPVPKLNIVDTQILKHINDLFGYKI